MITMNAIEKSYVKGTKALDDINFHVKKGELFGLIGPDGAGKTTIFRILTTLILPDSGTAEVNGFDIQKDLWSIRKMVGYMPGKFSLYQDLTVEENLKFFATVHATTIEENYEQIKDIYIQLEPFKTRRAGKLSGGMKQKLALCCALVHKPVVLFLDEPTTGVDAVSRKEFWDMLDKFKSQGITILVSTPYMDEATRCDTIALIQNGKILSINTPQNIIDTFPVPLFAIRSNSIYELLKLLRQHENTRSVHAFGESLHITFKTDDAAKHDELVSELNQKGQKDIRLQKIIPGIEDCFIDLLKN